MAYELFCGSVQGYSHIKKDIPCEDYGTVKEGDGEAAVFKVFALGDGHGDSNCPRSSYGSKTVCQITAEELLRFARDIKSLGWTEQLFETRSARMLVTQLVTAIFGKWSCIVNEDFDRRGLSEEEMAGCNRYLEYYKRGERIEHIYGTTLIAGLVTDEYLLLLQQGDGRCVVFNENGELTQPIPWDERCIANVTTSVCDTDAVQSCRFHVINLKENRVVACVAGSDGIEDSVANMDLMHVFYRRELEIAAREGVDAYSRHLLDTLPDFSKNGNGDDCTVCGFIDREAYLARLRKYDKDNRLTEITCTLESVREKLDSMKPKLAFLTKRCAEADAEYQTLLEKYNRLKTEYTEINDDLEEFGQNGSDPSANPLASLFNGIRSKLLRQSSVQCLVVRRDALKKEGFEVQSQLKAALAEKTKRDEELSQYKERFESFEETERHYSQAYDALMSEPDVIDEPVSAPTAAEVTVEESAEVETVKAEETEVEETETEKAEVEEIEVEESKGEEVEAEVTETEATGAEVTEAEAPETEVTEAEVTEAEAAETEVDETEPTVPEAPTQTSTEQAPPKETEDYDVLTDFFSDKF